MMATATATRRQRRKGKSRRRRIRISRKEAIGEMLAAMVDGVQVVCHDVFEELIPWGATIGNLADEAGKSWTTCNNFIYQITEHPHLETASAIASALGVEATELDILIEIGEGNRALRRSNRRKRVRG